MRRLLVLASLLLVVAMVVGPTGAIVIPYSVEKLSTDAPLIVRGRVAAAAPRWKQEARGELIVTEFTIDVTEVLKGQLPAGTRGGRIALECDGGTVGQASMRNCEEAVVRNGEDVVLFLTPHLYSPGKQRVFGSFQGKFTILEERVRELKDRTWTEFRNQIIAAAAGSEKK